MDCITCLAVQKTKHELFDGDYVLMNNSGLLFDYIRFRFMGSFVYGLFPTEKMSLLNAMVIGIIMYILVGTWGF